MRMDRKMANYGLMMAADCIWVMDAANMSVELWGPTEKESSLFLRF